MTNRILKWYAIGLTLLVIAYFIQLACKPEPQIYEYHVNVELYSGEPFYDVYDGTTNEFVGRAAMDTSDFDNVIINDNQ